MKGAYALVIKVESPLELHIGSLGLFSFKKGFWIYVGSAMGDGSTSLAHRLARHFRKEKKKHWHIDYLLEAGAKLQSAVWAQSDSPKECSISRRLGQINEVTRGPQGFGSTDCHAGCGTHLFHYKGKDDIEKVLVALMLELGLKPVMSPNNERISSDLNGGPINKD